MAPSSSNTPPTAKGDPTGQMGLFTGMPSLPPSIELGAVVQAPIPPVPRALVSKPTVQPTESDETTTQPLIFTVSEVTRRIQGALSQDPLLGKAITVEGEVSNFKRSSRGHVYFTLRDATASISCVVWASTAAKLKFEAGEGMAVFATGTLDIYAPSGSYSLVIKKLEPVGMGALQLAFIQLKEKLTLEGLFNDDRKQPLPVNPSRVGIVTASTGAVIHDMLRVIRRKNPMVDVVLAPVKVQGEGAATEIAQAIAALQNPLLGCDVLIVGRGGGSFEDLFCFSEEPVVRAIAACRVPVVTGIGHEPDFALADAASDYSASTPTAAAEATVADVVAQQAHNMASVFGLAQRVEQWLGFAEQQLDRQVEQLDGGLRHQAVAAEHTLTHLHTALTHGMATVMDRHEATVQELGQTLHAYSPLATLQRGYTLAQATSTGELLTQRAQFAHGQVFTLRLQDGQITAQVVGT
jgi:exodeoxyribonuclease VII large subunit